MSQNAPTDLQGQFHRYVAVLFALTVPALAAVEMTGAMATSVDSIRWVGYVVLTAWSVHIFRSARPNAAVLVLAAMSYSASLVVVESLFGQMRSAFDFTTTFGLVMVLSVLAGTLVSGSRLAWAGAIGLSVALWVVLVGVLQGEPPDVMSVRAVIAVAGVIFTTALVSRLFSQLGAAIERHERSARLQDAIARCSEALLVHSDSFASYEAVKALREASNAEYAYVYAVDGGEPGQVGWHVVADASMHSAGQRPLNREGTFEEIPETYATLAAGDAVTIRAKDESSPDFQYYADRGIVSEISIPIAVEGRLRGAVGFTQQTDERAWAHAEVQTLWRAAHMIGAYWRRQDDAQELRSSAESKDRLLASVSHEIRTPLTAIVGLSEEIVSSRTSLGEEERDELNGIIAVQSRELAELVEDLLVASRADFGNLSIRPEFIDLGEQAQRVLTGVKESHRNDKQIILTGDEVTAWADPLRVRQVMRNLVTNAIKYGGTHIVVGVRNVNGFAQVVVADNGAGVPLSESDLIFERYYRSAQSPTEPGSVGIGLSVSRQLAEMMGGTLEYVDGETHRFELSLPPAPVLDLEVDETVPAGTS